MPFGRHIEQPITTGVASPEARRAGEEAFTLDDLAGLYLMLMAERGVTRAPVFLKRAFGTKPPVPGAPGVTPGRMREIQTARRQGRVASQPRVEGSPAQRSMERFEREVATRRPRTVRDEIEQFTWREAQRLGDIAARTPTGITGQEKLMRAIRTGFEQRTRIGQEGLYIDRLMRQIQQGE